MYECQHFDIKELVYPELYAMAKATGRIPKLWGCFDNRILRSADLVWQVINDIAGKKTSVNINDWAWGGRFKESGLRPAGIPVGYLDQSKYGEVINFNVADPALILRTGTGAPLSQHFFGRALDSRSNTGSWVPEELREYMKKIGCFKPGFLDRTDAEAAPFLLITRIEWIDNMGWFHMDCSPIGSTDGSIEIVTY